MDALPENDRRRFLTAALGFTGSVAAAAVLGPSEAEAQALKRGSVGSSELSVDTLYSNAVSATHLTGEAADRLAIRRLVDAWAHCADRRLAEQQVALFIEDGVVNNYDGDPATHKPTTLKGRAELLKALAVLNTFTTTFHFNGQSEVAIRGDHATGESYCIAHQIFQRDGQRKLQVLAIRYLDTFVRRGDAWFFAERNLIIDFSDTRASVA